MASEIGSIQPNPYIFNIENRRKRKARLAHEIGAGSRCRKCEDKCPGFQLHFWRKICQNCRCGKDDHEVEDDDEDIGKIVIGKLFERPIRTKEEEQQYSYGTDLEMVNDSTGQKEKLKFDWIPPGVERAIAKRYMEMLPPEKRPIAGSEAAKERRRQLEQQLPLYDMDESERCESLLPAELKNFHHYLEVLRTSAAGQGSVQEIVPLAWRQEPATALSNLNNFPPPPDSWMNSNALLGEEYSGDASNNENMANSLNQINNNFIDSKSAFMNNLLQANEKSLQNDETNAAALEGLSINNMPGRASTLSEVGVPIKSQYVPTQIEFAVPGPLDEIGQTQPLTPSKRPMGELTYSLSRTTQSPNFSESKSNIVQLASPKPFIAKSEQRAVKPGQFSTSLSESQRLKGDFGGHLPNVNENAQSFEGPQFAQTPSEFIENKDGRPVGLSLTQMTPRDGRVTSYDAVQAPYSAHKEKLSAQGGRSADGRNVTILFPQESENLGMKERTINLGEDSSGAHFSCQYCKKHMRPGDVAVICERAGPGKYWHPKCFVCFTCKELLADLIYFYKDGQVFCGRHYTQAMDIPRCKACDELIFGDSWTRADNCNWHIHHFCCFICDKPLAGSKYIPDEKDFPHCLSCYMSFKAKMCETCEDKISPEQTRAGYNGYFFHALPECFCCYSCRIPLIGRRFKMVKNWVFCSKDCVVASEMELSMNSNPMKKEI